MRKYIVPTKHMVKEWRELFDEVFRDEEHQTAMISTLVALAAWMNSPKLRQSEYFIDLLEATMKYAVELTETGAVSEVNTDAAAEIGYEFVLTMADYLKEIGVVLSPSVLKFEHFVGMDILIKILDEGEVDETLKIPIDDLERLNG